MTFGETLTTFWPIITTILAGVIATIGVYINLSKRVDAIRADAVATKDSLLADGAERDKEISELKGRINTLQPVVGTIQTDIAVIKNTLEFIKGAVQGKPTQAVLNNTI